MATCSITEPFTMDGEAFYSAVAKSMAWSENNKEQLKHKVSYEELKGRKLETVVRKIIKEK